MRELDYYDANKIAFDVLGVGANVEAIALVRAGYAAGYRAAQEAMPPREPTRAMLTAGWRCMGTTAAAWRAMHDAWTQEQTSGAASAETDGPAADPIADLCARLRDKTFLPEFWRQLEAADALERLARELDEARAERDTLRECVREADGQLSRILHELAGSASLCWEPKPTGGFHSTQACEFVATAIEELRAILRDDAARAKVKP